MKKFILAFLVSTSAFAGALDHTASQTDRALLGTDVCSRVSYSNGAKCAVGVRNAIYNNMNGADFVRAVCGQFKTSDGAFMYSNCLEKMIQFSNQGIELTVCDKAAPQAATYFGTSKQARYAQCLENNLLLSIR